MRKIEQQNMIKRKSQQLPYQPLPHRQWERIFVQVSGKLYITQWLPLREHVNVNVFPPPKSVGHICEHLSQLESSPVHFGAEGHLHQQPHRSNWTLKIFAVDLIYHSQLNLGYVGATTKMEIWEIFGLPNDYQYWGYGVAVPRASSLEKLWQQDIKGTLCTLYKIQLNNSIMTITIYKYAIEIVGLVYQAAIGMENFTNALCKYDMHVSIYT